MLSNGSLSILTEYESGDGSGERVPLLLLLLLPVAAAAEGLLAVTPGMLGCGRVPIGATPLTVPLVACREDERRGGERSGDEAEVRLLCPRAWDGKLKVAEREDGGDGECESLPECMGETSGLECANDVDSDRPGDGFLMEPLLGFADARGVPLSRPSAAYMGP